MSAPFVTSGGRAVRVASSPYVALSESVNELQRAVEDLRWINLNDDPRSAGNEDDPDTRRATLTKIRVVRRRNPLAKQAVNLLKHYVIGQGISLKANNKTLVARIVDEFWGNPTNKVTFTGHQGMQEFLDTIYTDGEAFLVLFPDEDEGTLELGMLDTMEVHDIIPDRENRKIARWYKVRSTKRTYDFTANQWRTERVSGPNEWVYYRDWRNDSDADAPPASRQQDGLIYHVAINRRGLRGESELVAALDWIVTHRDFMQNRGTINKAAAMFAWRKKRKGPAADIAATVARLQSSLTNNGTGWESNPPPAAGSTVVENDASTTEWLKTDTGGGAADYDERKFRMMAGSGLGGVPNHYFGDEAQANLATATAMELPLLKTYQDWQTLLAGVVADILEFQLNVAHAAGRIGPRDDSNRYSERVTTPQQVIDADAEVQEAVGSNPGVGISPGAITQLTLIPKAEPPAVSQTRVDTTGAIDWYVDVDFPPILEKDLGQQVTSLKALYETLPTGNIESQKLVVELMLQAFGQNDIDQLMERLFPPDMAPVVAPQPPNLQTALAGLLAQPPPGGAQKAPVAESLDPLAEYRVRRLLKAVSDVRDTYARTGS